MLHDHQSGERRSKSDTGVVDSLAGVVSGVLRQGDKTYGDLVKAKANFTETVCVWQAPAKDKDGNIDKDFCLAGFRGVDLDFSVNISEVEKIDFAFGSKQTKFI